MENKKIWLSADGLRLAGEVFVPDGTGPHPALCICHGIPAQPRDPQDRGYSILAESTCAQGFFTLIFSFRGCGESEGNFDILAWARDLEVAVDFLHNSEEVDIKRLSVLGFSGGAAVCIYCAARDKRISSVVACACPAGFSALNEEEKVKSLIAQSRHTGVIRDDDFPPSADEWMRGFQQISPINWVRRISPRPLLIVHGDCDQVCSLSDAWQLYYEAKKPKDMSIITGGEHRLRLNEAAMSNAMGWLRKVNKLPSPG